MLGFRLSSQSYKPSRGGEMDSPSQDGVFGQQRTQDSNNTATDVLESPSKAINRFGLWPSPQNSEDSSSDDDQVPTQDLQSPSRAANLFTFKPSRPQGTIGDPTRTEVLRPPASALATPPVSNPSHLDDVQTIGDDLNAHQPSSDHSPNFPVPMDVLPPPSTVLGPKQSLPPSMFKDGSLQGPDVSHAEFIRLGGWEGTVDLLDTLRRLYANEQSTLKDLYACRLKLASHIHQLQTAIWARSTAEENHTSSSLLVFSEGPNVPKPNPGY
ncbi:hypothetical protein BKA70DRAFT_1243550 [Coprinopsis sp. MPI-PUGE-AT-0042]|nr:hypothetical protein BKA70DRAFT_1243550 [Coprinopsis sp. MPI-PUGE-AT-0042]